jgi:two-component system, OmpR family, KDP operon response regulator KdpE
MSEGNAKILIIEDEPQIRRFVRTALNAQKFEVIEAENGRQGITAAATGKPDLVILDLGLPDMDGVEIVRSLREWTSIPIIVLSARTTESAKIASLDQGADDYLAKPFGMGELMARIRVALRHAIGNSSNAHGEFITGNLKVDQVRRKVYVGNQEIHLTPIEYRLLSALIKNAGRVITHRQLLREVWGPSHSEDNHYVRIYMAQLRHKLEKDPAQPKLLLTEAGVGYRLSDN